jgi:hypothetical protein
VLNREEEREEERFEKKDYECLRRIKTREEEKRT